MHFSASERDVRTHVHKLAHTHVALCEGGAVYLFCFFCECVYCFISLLVYGVCVTPSWRVNTR